MMEDSMFTRPLRAAANLTGSGEQELKHTFYDRRILVAIEPDFVRVRDAQETLIFAVNQALRFCPNVGVSIPPGHTDLLHECNRVMADIYGIGHQVRLADLSEARFYDAVINIGTRVLQGLPAVTVNSSGWVARVATANSTHERLFWEPHPYNPIGALGAACQGAGSAFLRLLGKQQAEFQELSLFELIRALPGTLRPGPPLPESQLKIDALLVGCGAVMNGWAYTVKRLPIVGRLEAIDKQSLRPVNFGPYVASAREFLNRPKVEIIRVLLSPAIAVTARTDEWELFKIRIEHGTPVPPLIVAGLDNVATRHSVQRLWPRILIDMGAGGMTSQVIVKRRDNNGLCLLRALAVPPTELTWAQRLAQETGLSVERILDGPTSKITQDDVNAAPLDKRALLEADLLEGGQICGRITKQNLEFEADDPDFAPAVPFVTAFSGVVAAAETVKWLMGDRRSRALHFQRSFLSGKTRAMEMDCNPECECQGISPGNILESRHLEKTLGGEKV
jgi:hypothetical protein